MFDVFRQNNVVASTSISEKIEESKVATLFIWNKHFLPVLVYFFFELVSLKAVKADIFIQVRDLSPAIGASERKMEVFQVKSRVRRESWQVYTADKGCPTKV